MCRVSDAEPRDGGLDDGAGQFEPDNKAAERLTLAHKLGAPVWLRGGWAIDFFLGRLTRDHADIDWFALAEDGERRPVRPLW